MPKKLLILAGSHFQIPVINYAKRSGHIVITCDNRPDNPGHHLADKYYNVSTTDSAGILEVAEMEKINGILAYGSDVAALTGAYVSEKLNLTGNSFNTVKTLTDKGVFRNFLADNGYPIPHFKVTNSLKEAERYCSKIHEKVFIKPVDSSGSKGITIISPGGKIKAAFDYAMEFSRKKEIIIEKEIIRKGPHIHGEAFMYKGELKFMLLGDQYFCYVNPCAPLSTTLPGFSHKEIMGNIREMLVSLISAAGFNTGGLNIEIIRGIDDKIYFIEIGPRSGGNFMPELAFLATGFDIASANVNSALGESVDFKYSDPDGHFCTQVILHSHSDGKYLKPNIPEVFNKYERKRVIYYNEGDPVRKYRGSIDVIGVILYKFRNREECKRIIRFITMNNIVTIN